MLYAVGAQIPEYRVRAFNNASDSTNLIHADEHARRYGYRGGLVPGVSIFAYMSRSLVDFLGRAWLERGSADVRFLHPIYDGEEVRVSGAERPGGHLRARHGGAAPRGALPGAGQE